ncbi:MAG: hypothetical protein ACTS8Z_02035 [Candidatus Limnocylindrales bacterium]
MSAGGWNYADLEPEQLALVVEAERTLDADVVVAYEPSAWGTIENESMPPGLEPAGLEASQLESLQHLERVVDGVLVAYRLTVD